MIHPQELKTLTNNKPIREAKLPKKVIIPLSQHTGKPASPIIEIGDFVYPGTTVGVQTGFISSAVHSSISGKVVAIEEYPHPVVRRSLCVVIESDGRDLQWFDKKITTGIESVSSDIMRQLITDCGVVGMGGAAFPTHVKLAPPKTKTIDTLIINGAECEPYLTCDDRLMVECSSEILEGAKIAMKLLGVKNCFIGIESNKPNAIKLMSKATQEAPDIKVVKVKTQYPQGAEKQLIKTILNRTVPQGKLPFDVGVIMHNVATLIAIYEAVFFRKALYERVVTVSGGCINTPANLLVKIGTPISDLIEECGGLRKDPVKIIMGGPMMGIAIYDMDTPVIKGTSGILFLDEKELDLTASGTCIRCGKCIETCPINLAPTTIYSFVENEKFEEAEECNVLDCIECGACSWACPSKLDLVGMFKFTKMMLNLTKLNKGGPK